jgi:uncharacterized membrane protein YfcA
VAQNTSAQQLIRYAKQSEVRVRSGIKLVTFLLIIVAVGAAFSVWWVAKVGGAVAAFFSLVTLAEFMNGRRRRRQAETTDHQS